MNDLQVFMFEKQQVRIVDRNGDPWFVAKDICDVLGIQNPSNALQNFPENEKAALDIIYGSSNGVQQKREMNIINEPGLYRLIFQSRKPEAEAFKTWVFTQVLPSIRKTGTYNIAAQNDVLTELALIKTAIAVQARSLQQLSSRLPDNSREEAYRELEEFIGRTIMPDEKPISRIYVRELWHAYEKEVKNPLDRHVFMYKIAMDHPEYPLKSGRDWYFDRCDRKRLI